MEQYIYIFTIILEIIVFAQVANAIIKLDKKVVQINSDVVLMKSEIELALRTFKKFIKKFNKVATIIVKVKKFHIKRLILIAIEIVNLFFLFRTFKTYKGLSKIKFLQKLFSYSLIKGFVLNLKNFI